MDLHKFRMDDVRILLLPIGGKRIAAGMGDCQFDHELVERLLDPVPDARKVGIAHVTP